MACSLFSFQFNWEANECIIEEYDRSSSCSQSAGSQLEKACFGGAKFALSDERASMDGFTAIPNRNALCVSNVL